MDTPQSPEQVVPVIRNLLITYRQALVSSVSFADTQLHQLPWDAFTWATLVRYWAWQEMHQAQRAGSELDWSARRLACNGMEMRSGQFTLRPFKAIQAGPPAPGPSQVKQAYYRQHGHDFLQGSFFPDPALPQGANLLIDWRLGGQKQPILALSKPVNVWRYRGTPELEWRITVDFDGGDPAGGLSFTPFDPEDSDFDFSVDCSEIDSAASTSA